MWSRMLRSRVAAAVACVSLVALAGLRMPAAAVTFTTDTTITSAQYVGQDIVVQGCTLTIDCSPGKGNYASITL